MVLLVRWHRGLANIVVVTLRLGPRFVRIGRVHSVS
jgi:hypothetical protein